MKKKRLIPVLLLRHGWLVQSKGFKRHQNLGNPSTFVARLSEWASDDATPGRSCARASSPARGFAEPYARALWTST